MSRPLPTCPSKTSAAPEPTRCGLLHGRSRRHRARGATSRPLNPALASGLNPAARAARCLVGVTVPTASASISRRWTGARRALAVAALCALGGAARADDLAVVGATLLDGTGSPPISDSVLVVSGERIRAAGPRAAVSIPKGIRIV